MFCSKCGKEITGDEKFCPNCGNPITQTSTTQSEYSNPAMNFRPAIMPPKSKTTAALLAFFLGIFGAHNFYLGHTGRAVGQLILTFTFVGSAISAIWSFVEFIMILTGDLKDSGGASLSN